MVRLVKVEKGLEYFYIHNLMFNKKGFTLIELLVVIAVIGLLASIVLVAIGPARDKARDARRQSDIRQINLAMEMCYDDSSCGAGSEKYYNTASAPTSIGSYLVAVPVDPINADSYVYTWIANASPYQYYCVYAVLQGEDDTYVCASNKGVLTKTAASYTPTKDDCCGVDTD